MVIFYFMTVFMVIVLQFEGVYLVKQMCCAQRNGKLRLLLMCLKIVKGSRTLWAGRVVRKWCGLNLFDISEGKNKAITGRRI